LAFAFYRGVLARMAAMLWSTSSSVVFQELRVASTAHTSTPLARWEDWGSRRRS
jgi:hypothetical protein